jgi:hypothetical protein
MMVLYRSEISCWRWKNSRTLNWSPFTQKMCSLFPWHTEFPVYLYRNGAELFEILHLRIILHLRNCTLLRFGFFEIRLRVLLKNSEIFLKKCPKNSEVRLGRSYRAEILHKQALLVYTRNCIGANGAVWNTGQNETRILFFDETNFKLVFGEK